MTRRDVKDRFMDHYMQHTGIGNFESLYCLILSLPRSLFLTPSNCIILFTQKNPATVVGQTVKNEHLSSCFNSDREAVELLDPENSTSHTGPNTNKRFLISESSK